MTGFGAGGGKLKKKKKKNDWVYNHNIGSEEHK